MTTKLFPVVCLPVLAIFCLIAVPAATVSAETLFTFGCGAGISATGYSGGADLCTTTTNKNTGVVTYHNPGTSAAIYDWSVGNFDLTSTAGGWEFATSNGDPAPGLKTGNAISGVATNTLTLTDGGGLFIFGGVDLKSSAKPTVANPMPYSVLGYLDGTLVFNSIDGNLSTTWTTTSVSSLAVDELVFTLNDSKGTDYLDTLSVNQVDAPEPTSLLLLGSGLLALGGMVRRKVRG